MTNTPNSASPARPGNGHPVADNPLRMLFGARNEGSTLKDLERNAKALRLQSKSGSISPKEPLYELCPRLRSVEDYGWALKQVGNPTHLALALFFWPSSFGVQNPMQRANRCLLEAEGLPQGTGRKAELLTQAIRDYDDQAAEDWAEHAVVTARQMIEAEPDIQELKKLVGESVKRVAERVIADFGDTIEASEIDLLNAIDDCVRLPEIQGASRAAESVIQKQLEHIDGYLTHAYELLGQAANWKFQGLPGSEISQLVSGCERAREAFALLARRPALLRSMPQDRIIHLSTVSVVLALQIGTELSQWDAARRLAKGVDPKQIDPAVGQELHCVLKVACRAIPLLHLAYHGQDVSSAFESLRREFSDSSHVIENFKQRALVLRDRKAGPRLSQRAAPASQQGTGCAVTILGLVLMLVLANSCGDSSKPSSRATSQTYRVPRSTASDFSAEQAAIEQQRRSVQIMFDRVDTLKHQLDLDARYLDRSSSFSVSSYNRKVQDYNAELSAARAAQDGLNARVDNYNARLRQTAR